MNTIEELARLRARVATLEAENAELRASQTPKTSDEEDWESSAEWYDSGCYIDDDGWYSSSC